MIESSNRRPLGALSSYYFIISSTAALPDHPWSQGTKVIFTEETCWGGKSSVNHEKIEILSRGLSTSGNVEVGSLRKHQQTGALWAGGVSEDLYFMDYEWPFFRWRLHPHSRAMGNCLWVLDRDERVSQVVRETNPLNADRKLTKDCAWWTIDEENILKSL